jgi:hypothetical protein
MRGDVTMQAMELPEDALDYGASSTPDYVAKPNDSLDATTSNLTWSKKFSLYWLLMMAILYGIWGYLQNRETSENFKAGEMKINLENFVKVTIAVVIGVNFITVFLTKLASLRIPVISKGAGALLPIFSV